MRDPFSGLPVYSLYGATREPDDAMLENVDVLLVDLPDIGTRVYTFVWTVVNCLKAAARVGKEVTIFDRPNPIGGHLVEGNLLQKEWSSFVGLHEIPMRHGLTMAELALLCNREMGINAEMNVIPVKGWQRSMFVNESVFPWVFPSPNMPSFSTALVYPGQVIWEGTNVSEGRGTTLPFLLCGAPYLRYRDVLQILDKTPLPGCILRPLAFEPTSGKWEGEVCNGFQVHVTDPVTFRPYRTSIALLRTLIHLYPDDFAYKQPPYEYEFEKLPMDLILGDRKVRLALEDGVDIIDLEQSWTEELNKFEEQRHSVFLYDDE